MCDVLRRENDVDFLSFRLWIGVWIALILLLAVALDLSALIRYITRFTEESFAVLISIIFMYESIVNVVDIWLTHPLRTGAATTAREQCYCGSHNVTAAKNNYYDDYRVSQVATVAVQLYETRLNSSFYRFNISSRFHIISSYHIISYHVVDLKRQNRLKVGTNKLKLKVKMQSVSDDDVRKRLLEKPRFELPAKGVFSLGRCYIFWQGVAGLRASNWETTATDG